MPSPPVPAATLQAAVNALRAHGGVKEYAAKALGIPVGTLKHRLKLAATQLKPFRSPSLPGATLSVADIRRRRKEQYAQLQKAKTARALIPVTVNIDGPVAIAHFGDPHLDDDGTDLERIERDTELVLRTPGMFAANIGDGINAWTGRLARLYSEQSTSEAEAIALYEWWLQTISPRMLYCLGGNHLAWHSGMGQSLHRWILANCTGVFDNTSARMDLQFPNGRRVRVNARHDFSGHSMWNTAHGPLKAATMGWRDHVLTCGHTHTSGYSVLKDPATGLISHAIRVSSYKTYDRYAEEKGLPNQDIFCNAVTVIDPRYGDDDPRLVHVCFDVEQAADYLTWLRKRAS